MSLPYPPLVNIAVPTFADLPPGYVDGALGTTLDTNTVYVYDGATATWVAAGGGLTPGSVADTATVDLTVTLGVLTADVVNGSIGNTQLGTGINANKIADGSVSDTEFQYLDGVTSDIQTQLDGKQATGNYITSLTGEATASGPGAAATTLTNSAVIGKVLTGYTPGAGTIAATDTILQAFNKVGGNAGTYLPLAGGTMTGQLVSAVGTVGAPGIAFAGSLTTGMYSAATNTLALATNGVQRVNILSTGEVGIGTATPGTALDVNGRINATNYRTSSTAFNVVAGDSAGGSLTTGNGNVVVGYQAGNAMPSGATQNTILGYQAGFLSTGNAQTFFGYQAGLNTASSAGVTVMGFQAGLSNTSGSGLTAIGDQAGRSSTTASGNSWFGRYAGFTNTGSANTGVGDQALYQVVGDDNVAVGSLAGYGITSGSRLTFVGKDAGLTSTATGLTNATAIGYNAQVGASNSLVLGGTGGSAVSVGIGTTTPAVALHVVGTARVTDLQELPNTTNASFYPAGATASASAASATSNQTATVTFGTDSMEFVVRIGVGANERAAIKCFADYNSATITALSDPSGYFLPTDAGTGIYISKSATSAVVSFKNRMGGTRTIQVACQDTTITSATAWT